MGSWRVSKKLQRELKAERKQVSVILEQGLPLQDEGIQ